MSTHLAREALKEASQSEPDEMPEACLSALSVYLPLLKATIHQGGDSLDALQASLDRLSELDSELELLNTSTESKRAFLLNAVTFAYELQSIELLEKGALSRIHKALSICDLSNPSPHYATRYSACLKFQFGLYSQKVDSTHCVQIIGDFNEALKQLEHIFSISGMPAIHEKPCIECIYENFPDAVLNRLKNEREFEPTQTIMIVKQDFEQLIKAIILDCS